MSEVEAGQAADDGRASDQTRRRFLTAATSGISAVGVVGVAVPFMAMCAGCALHDILTTFVVPSNAVTGVELLLVAVTVTVFAVFKSKQAKPLSFNLVICFFLYFLNLFSYLYADLTYEVVTLLQQALHG